MLPIALGLLLIGAPAHATGTIECRTTDGSDIAIRLTVGHTITSPVVGAQLRIGDRVLSTVGEEPQVAIGRSWVDQGEIRVDLVDPNVERFEAELRATTDNRGARGTIRRDEVDHPARCSEES
ncbi:MAG: hypothetical protein ACXWU1_07935 [Allosphingosinicella sp.]